MVTTLLHSPEGCDTLPTVTLQKKLWHFAVKCFTSELYPQALAFWQAEAKETKCPTHATVLYNKKPPCSKRNDTLFEKRGNTEKETRLFFYRLK